MKIEKENKYFVLKQDDITEFFEQFQEGMFLNDKGEKLSKAFDNIIAGVGDLRESQKKPRFNNYIVCNQDESYAELVWQIILLGEKAKQEGWSNQGKT